MCSQYMVYPPFVSTKTLFSHHSCGFGIPFSPVLQPTRVLEAVHKAQQYCTWTWTPTKPPYRPPALFFQARSCLYGPSSQPPLPFATVPATLSPCPPAFVLEVYRSRYPAAQLSDGRSDGFVHPKADLSASATVCPDGYGTYLRA